MKFTKEQSEELLGLSNRVRMLIWSFGDSGVSLKNLRYVIEQEEDADDVWSMLLTMVARGEINMNPVDYVVTLNW